MFISLFSHPVQIVLLKQYFTVGGDKAREQGRIPGLGIKYANEICSMLVKGNQILTLPIKG